jgi:hypothetical protein
MKPNDANGRLPTSKRPFRTGSADRQKARYDYTRYPVFHGTLLLLVICSGS